MTLQQMKQRWAGLQRREQQLLMVAFVATTVAIFYFFIWQPLQSTVQQQQADLRQVQAQLNQIRSLPAAAATQTMAGSLTDIISSTAKKYQIKVNRMQPQNEQMQVMLDDLSFDQLMNWLHELQYQHKVSVVQLDIGTADEAGLVRVRRLVVEA